MSDIVKRAQQLQEARQARTQQLLKSPAGTGAGTSVLSPTDLYMKLGLHSLALVKTLVSLPVYKFALLYTERGLCSRSRMALKLAVKDVDSVSTLQSMSKSIYDTCTQILSLTTTSEENNHA